VSGHLERLKRLEMKVPERAELSGPAAAWAAVLWGKGTPGLVARACRPYLAELQIKLLSHGRYAMENRCPISGYYGFALTPLRLLAEIIAYPAEDPLPDQLLRWRRPPLYDPDYWRRRGTRYRDLYTEWIQSEIAWLISPELEAVHLRQRLHAGKLPDLPEPVDFDGSTTLAAWPDGLFILVEACCQTKKGGHPRTKVDTPGGSTL
jgi:hypothetical protein